MLFVLVALAELKTSSVMQGIDIITMKCVKYDQEIAQDLRNKSTGEVISQTKAKNTKRGLQFKIRLRILILSNWILQAEVRVGFVEVQGSHIRVC